MWLRPTIDDAKMLQAMMGLGERHVIFTDDHGFVMAHTDAERAQGKAAMHNCPTHREWGSYFSNPVAPGWYIW